MKKYSLNIIIHIGYDDEGEMKPHKLIDEQLEHHRDIEAVKAMLRKIMGWKESYANIPDVNILAKLTDEKGKLVSVYDD